MTMSVEDRFQFLFTTIQSRGIKSIVFNKCCNERMNVAVNYSVLQPTRIDDDIFNHFDDGSGKILAGRFLAVSLGLI
jgi:hypothetical protein